MSSEKKRVPADEPAPEGGPGPWEFRAGVWDNGLLAVGSLVLMTVVLMQEYLGAWSFLPGVVGLLGVIASWGGGPPLVLFLLVCILGARRVIAPPMWGPEAGHGSPLLDLLLAAAVLVYLGAANRLLSLVRQSVPHDPRLAKRVRHGRLVGRWLLPFAGSARTVEQPGKGEVAGLIGAGILSGVVGSLLWWRLATEPVPRELGLDYWVWRAVLVVWAVFVGAVVVHGLHAYLARAGASREESLLYLQDQLWEATHGEQRRVNRWIAWARLRRQKKETNR